MLDKCLLKKLSQTQTLALLSASELQTGPLRLLRKPHRRQVQGLGERGRRGEPAAAAPPGACAPPPSRGRPWPGHSTRSFFLYFIFTTLLRCN